MEKPEESFRFSSSIICFVVLVFSSPEKSQKNFRAHAKRASYKAVTGTVFPLISALPLISAPSFFQENVCFHCNTLSRNFGTSPKKQSIIVQNRSILSKICLEREDIVLKSQKAVMKLKTINLLEGQVGAICRGIKNTDEWK